MSHRFAAGEQQWQARLGNLRDVVRQELVARQLRANLPAAPSRVLDIGCGQGTQALRVARQGHQVTALDASAELLARLERDLAAEPHTTRQRLRIVRGDAEHAADLFAPASFEAVLCHGVLMYLTDPDPVLQAIAQLTVSGGLVSLLVRNGDALAMRPGLLGDWTTALEAFTTTWYRNRLGITARADRLDELAAILTRHQLPLRAWYGVRVFTDTATNDAAAPTGERLEALLACEERAGRTDPYRRVAPLLHIMARRS
jgi:S-adenosylmethionine-dependent methyltransferase